MTKIEKHNHLYYFVTNNTYIAYCIQKILIIKFEVLWINPISNSKSANSKRIDSDRRNKLQDSTSVITVRIDEELNSYIDKFRQKLGLSKADFIRNYLELSKFIIKQKGSIKSLNDRDFIIIKRSYLRKLIENVPEEEQLKLGDKFGTFINAGIS